MFSKFKVSEFRKLCHARINFVEAPELKKIQCLCTHFKIEKKKNKIENPIFL